MRIIYTLALALLSLALTACSGVEIRPSETDTFAAGNYRYYKWRSEPLQNTIKSSDPIYIMDPIMRREVDSTLRSKGYILDRERAQFSVDYLYAVGLREGAKAEQASNISPIPSVTPNRQVDQAVVDNANALGGLKETSNIAVQFNDTGTREEVWRVIITKIMDNVNTVDSTKAADVLSKAVDKALRELPDAS
jgi:hypothetical protein